MNDKELAALVAPLFNCSPNNICNVVIFVAKHPEHYGEAVSTVPPDQFLPFLAGMARATLRGGMKWVAPGQEYFTESQIKQFIENVETGGDAQGPDA